MTTKKQNPWINAVKETKKKNPKMSLSEAIKETKKTYKKIKK